MRLGEYIQNRREELGMRRADLARKTCISDTEIRRIENGKRGCPSLSHLIAIADVLGVSQDTLLELAGFAFIKETPTVKQAFPGLKTEKQQATMEKIAARLEKNSDLKESDLDNIESLMKMYIKYVTWKNKNPV